MRLLLTSGGIRPGPVLDTVVELLGGPQSVIESRLRAADVVLGYGGSNHWLAHAWHASGLVPVLELDPVEPALPLLDRVATGTARLGAPVWFLDDETALLVRGPKAPPEVVGDGHRLRYDATGRVVEPVSTAHAS